MELRHLRYFRAVAEELHFGRAAQRLHIAQPPLSQQIRQLERELGVELLVRSTRRVELTPAGEAYLRRAVTILDAVDDAGRQAQRVAQGIEGRLAVGCVGSAWTTMAPSAGAPPRPKGSRAIQRVSSAGPRGSFACQPASTCTTVPTPAGAPSAR